MNPPYALHLLQPVAAGTRVAAVLDDASLPADLSRVEHALLVALERTGIAPDGAADAYAGADPVADLDVPALALDAVGGANPVIPFVRSVRPGLPEPAASWFHHGATSQDVLDTALALRARAALGETARDLATVGRTLAVLVDRHRATPAVARTLTQQAQPTTFGLRAAGWLAGVTDALVRVRAAARALPASLGGPVGTTAAYGGRGPEVVAAFADALGLAEPVVGWHTRRTPVLDVAHALAVAAGALGTIAADVLVMAQTEVDEVREGSGGPSSSMPHKRNPAEATLVAGAVRQVPGLLATVTASAVAENERPAGAWHAEWAPLHTALLVTGAAAERTAHLLAGLEVDTAAMTQHVRRLATLLETDPDVSAATEPWVVRVLDAWRAVGTAHPVPEEDP